MLEKIILFSIKNKLIIGVFIVALIGCGIWSFTQIPIDAVPDITDNQVQIITTNPSLATQEVERMITLPLESKIANIPDLVQVRSISRFGLSVITLVFKDKVDIYWARQQVSERLAGATEDIPLSIGKPELAPITSGLGEIYQYIIHPKHGFESKYNGTELRSIQDWMIRKQLLGTEGVADISSFGGYLKQYEISLDQNKLKSIGVNVLEVFSAVEKNNQNVGGSYIEKSSKSYFIRTEGILKSLEDIENIVVKNTLNGNPILIKNVAQVKIGHSQRFGAMTKNAQGEVSGGIVLMLKGSNSSKVIAAVKKRIIQIKKTLPEGLILEPYLDRTKLVNRAISTVSTNLIEGALIVIFVLVLLLGNIRAGLIVASVIPLSMLFAITMMNLFHVSGNLMSLGAIDFGLIVDGSVIIVEASLHHLQKRKNAGLLSQLEMDEEVFVSAKRIRNSAAFGEIIILMVYLPILALVGIEGKMFKPMAETVIFAIIGAFVLSLTYIPMISALCLDKKISLKKKFSDIMMEKAYQFYHPLLKFSLKNGKWLIGGAVVLFGFSLFIFNILGGQFIPSLDEGDFAVETRVVMGSSMNITIEEVQKSAKILLEKFPEVKKVIGKIGTSEIPTDPMPMEAADMIICLKDKSEWKEPKSMEMLAEEMKESLAVLPGVTFGFQQPIQMRFNELIAGIKQDVAIKIYGDNLEKLDSVADNIASKIKNIKGVNDLYVDKLNGLPQLMVNFDRQKIASFGLNVEDINTQISMAYAGKIAGNIYENERKYALVLRLDTSERNKIENIENLQIISKNGKTVPLNAIAEVSFKNGPIQITRENTKRRSTVAFNVRGRDVESIVEELDLKINNKEFLPNGYFLDYGGQFQNLKEAKQRLMIAVPVALLLIFILLFFTFGSLKQTLIVFSAIPLSSIGGIWALYLRGMPFSISAGIGFIALFGVAVLNGIVLIGEFNKLKKEENNKTIKTIFMGTEIRLRPILMTALVASLGFLPMALSHGAGAEVQKPLATVVIGGLISATILTLFLLPIAYLWIERKSKKSSGLRKSLIINKSIMSLFFIIMTFPFIGIFAQNLPKAISMDEAIKTAKEKNGFIKSKSFRNEGFTFIKKSSVDFGKTGFLFSYGQFNSYYLDNNFTINQNIPFPLIFKRNAQLYQKQIEMTSLEMKISENEIEYQIKQVFNEIEYQKSLLNFKFELEILFNKIIESSKRRLKAGDLSTIDFNFYDSQWEEIKLEIKNQKLEILSLERKLSLLVYSNESLTTQSNKIQRNVLNLNIDSSLMQSSLFIKSLKNEEEIKQAEISVEKSKLYPDFNLGYYNQSLYGTVNYKNRTEEANAQKRFQGLNFGLNIPIWAKPQMNRIKAAQSFKKSIVSNNEGLKNDFIIQINNLQKDLKKESNYLELYDSVLLNHSKTIKEYYSKNLEKGAINYFEFALGIKKYISIEEEYLLHLFQFNQITNKMNYIIHQ